jgi:hypothetical protein
LQDVSEAEIGELEALFRLIYRRDANANRFNGQKKHRPLERVRCDLSAWTGEAPGIQKVGHH